MDDGDRQAAGRDAEISGWTYPGLDYSTFRLSLVAKAIDRLTLKMLADNCDLTIAEWRVLSRLAPIRGASVRDISQMAWVDRAEVSRAAAALEARGLTSRRPDPSDGRSPILFATEQGLALYQRLLPIRVAISRPASVSVNSLFALLFGCSVRASRPCFSSARDARLTSARST